MNRTPRHSGFTMIELVAIVVILAIMALVALPRFTDLSRHSLIQAQSELVGAIRFAQESSMARVDDQYQIVIGGGDKYRVSRYDLDAASLSDITSPLSGSSPFVADAGEWNGISATAQTISFDNRGYPCSGTAPCTSPMSGTITVTLSGGSNSRSVTIEPITGYVYAN